MNHSSNKIVLILVILLIASNVAWVIEHSSQNAAIKKAQAELAGVVYNKKVLAFQKLFVDKVLKSNGDVDFNTRVELQNSAKETNDETIIKAWNNFLASKTEGEGQARVKELLSLLASSTYLE